MRHTNAIALVAATVCFLAMAGCGNGDDDSADQAPTPPPPARETPPKPPQVWHTYHGGPSLDGVADVRLPDALTQRWRFMAGAPVRTTPVGGSGRIYFANSKGRIFAIDAKGTEVWSKTFTRKSPRSDVVREASFDAPLVYLNDAIVAAEADGSIYCLSAEDGQERWTTEIDAVFLGSPNLSSTEDEKPRLLAIDQSFGALHCFDWATGKPLWQAEEVDRCDGSPGVGGGVVVFGSCAAALHIYSAKDGAYLREAPIDEDSQVAGGVAVVGESAFSGSRSGKVLRVNTATGKIDWVNDENEDEVFTTPAVDESHVVFGSADGVVACLDRSTGATKWSIQTEGMASSPVIAGDKVVVASDGTLLLLRLEDGHTLWSSEVSDEITSPAIIDGLVIVGNDDGTVAAFGAVLEQ